METKHIEELRISENKLSVMRGHDVFAHAKSNDDAKLIMKACNNHYDLLDALMAIVDAQDNPKKSLANLNSAIANGKKIIKKATE